MVKRKKVTKFKLPKIKRTDDKFVIQGPYGGLSSKDGRHIVERYKVRKTKDRDGKITLELIPFKKLQDKRRELVKELIPHFKEAVDAEGLLKDIFDDINVDNLEKLKVAINRGAKVKSKEGCFYFKIKDPRKKKPYSIQIRN